MSRNLEWDRLCAKYESAQDENTTAYLAITARIFAGGRNGEAAQPTPLELARWDAARARVRAIDERMRGFVAALVSDEATKRDGGNPSLEDSEHSRLH